ncbi:MAG TPA: SMP-30/gluconolactonase/LRE family protein [Syntrophales bacterium]|nr:SMP-30/gluconolactonase/LRE family protein [Syntrophales bacterium]
MKKIYFILPLLIVSTAMAQSPVPPGAKLEKLATGFLQVEGPVWYDGPGLKGAQDSSLLFSDIAGDKIYQYSPATGKATPFLSPSDSSNGMTFDQEGRLVFCQMWFRRVVRMNLDGTITPLASTFRGVKFNSPNDVVVKSDGAIFFTDPPFNIPVGQKQELPFSGIYRISSSGAVQLLDSTLAYPNGICFSPDESKLYVNDSYALTIYVWSVAGDSILEPKRVFATMKGPPFSGVADGMKVDPAGNVYSAGPLGVWVFDKSGNVLDTILVPETTSNLNWGDADRKTLYITASKSLYRIRLAKTTGIKKVGNNLNGPTFKLYPNYPNPFNPTTRIDYRLAINSNVTLKVFDTLGRNVSTLVDGRENAGVHSVTFDGGTLPSGVYFCKMDAIGNDGQEFVSTKKLVIMK